MDKLQKSWKNFFELQKSKGIKNPKPPRFKGKNEFFNFTFLNNAFKCIDDKAVQFSISKQQKEYLKATYSFDSNYLTLKMESFSTIKGTMKTIEFKPLKNKKYQINLVYEIEDIELKEDNNHYLSIDIGLSNSSK